MTDSYRKKLAALSFPEKVRILEQMREREVEIAKIREKLKTERLQQEQEKPVPLIPARRIVGCIEVPEARDHAAGN